MPEYRVIYIAGGVGERLRPYTYNTHKCLLEINGKTIFEHWIDALLHSGADVELVNVITGHYAYKFRELQMIPW